MKRAGVLIADSIAWSHAVWVSPLCCLIFVSRRWNQVVPPSTEVEMNNADQTKSTHSHRVTYSLSYNLIISKEFWALSFLSISSTMGNSKTNLQTQSNITLT